MTGIDSAKTEGALRYDYSFSVWPDETSARLKDCRAIFDLFRMLNGRIVMDFTEREFNDFREELAKVGFTLREIERQPFHTPETVL